MEDQRASPPGKCVILVVERDTELRDYLVRSHHSLKQAEPQLLEARDGDAAKEIMGSEEISLLIAGLDPSNGGHALCTRLDVGGHGQIPVLLLADATSSVVDIRDVRSLENTTLLEEPGAGALCRTVSQILGDRLPASGARQP